MDGFEASEKILKLTADYGDSDYCNIVALTSYSSTEVKERALKIGMKDIIYKPLHHKDL